MNDAHEPQLDTATRAASLIAVLAHSYDPNKTLVIPRRLINRIGDLETAALYSLIAQRVLMVAGLSGVRAAQASVAISSEELASELLVSVKKIGRMVNRLRELRLVTTALKQSEAHDWAPTNHFSCNFLREADMLIEWDDQPDE